MILMDLLHLQVEGCFPDTMTRCAELINNYTDVDFVDINSGCPIDLVFKKVIPTCQSHPSQSKYPVWSVWLVFLIEQMPHTKHVFAALVDKDKIRR